MVAGHEGADEETKAELLHEMAEEDARKKRQREDVEQRAKQLAADFVKLAVDLSRLASGES